MVSLDGDVYKSQAKFTDKEVQKVIKMCIHSREIKVSLGLTPSRLVGNARVRV